MSEYQNLLSKIKNGTADWNDFGLFLNLNEKELSSFFKLAQEIKKNYFGNKLKIYIPSIKFPAISLTGNKCELHCEHCDEKYLGGMKHILTNEDLENFLLYLSSSDGVGVLLSGGCEEDGSVPLYGFLETVKKIKNQTNLIINTHTGLLNELTAQKLADANVDIVSFDVNLDEEIIKNIYHLEKDLEDYKRAINILKKYNLNIVPHICIGLYYGELHKELDSIRFIKESQINPSLIVLIALIPPKGKESLFKRPLPIDIAKIIALIRFVFPKTEISLGCMRPRGDIKVETEKLAIEAGITRIEIPSTHTIKWLKERYTDINLDYFSACCAIPEKYEEIARSDEKDIKRYINI